MTVDQKHEAALFQAASQLTGEAGASFLVVAEQKKLNSDVPHQ